jgi:hypothetical protein
MLELEGEAAIHRFHCVAGFVERLLEPTHELLEQALVP